MQSKAAVFYLCYISWLFPTKFSVGMPLLNRRDSPVEKIAPEMHQILANFLHCRVHLTFRCTELAILTSNLLGPVEITQQLALAEYEERLKNKYRQLPNIRSTFCLVLAYILNSPESQIEPSKNSHFGSSSVLDPTAENPFKFRPHQVLVFLIAADNYLRASPYWDNGFIDISSPMYFLFHYQENQSHVNSVSIACVYCVNIVYHVNCTDVESCVENLQQTYEAMLNGGKNVRWHALLTNNYFENYGIYNGIQECPFRSLTCHRAVGLDSTVDFMFAALNRTLLQQRKIFWLGREYLPRIFNWNWISDKGYSVHISDLPASIQTDSLLQFITADSVTENSSVGNWYLDPFDKTLWIAIVVMIVGISALVYVTLLICSKNNSLSLIPWMVFWLLGSLIEQANQPDLPSLKNPSLKKAASIILASFALASVTLTNGYRSFVKSNYLKETTFNTNWTDLDEIQNFSLYFLIENYNHFRYLIQSEWPPVQYGHRLCEHSMDSEPEHGIGKAFCVIYEGYKSLRILDYYFDGEYKFNNCANFLTMSNTFDAKTYPCKYHLALLTANILQNAKLISIQDLPQIIKAELSERRTALVITRPHLDEVYQYFRSEMARTPSLRFAHNLKRKDTTIPEIVPRIAVTTWKVMDENHRDVVLRRLKVLMSSGIWFLWHRLSFNMWGALKTNAVQAFRPGEPLSFWMSDIYQIFVICGVMSIVAVVIFVIEITFAGIEKMQISFCFQKFVNLVLYYKGLMLSFTGRLDRQLQQLVVFGRIHRNRVKN